MTHFAQVIKVGDADRAHPFARFVPERWRRAHHWFAASNGYFWLPCALCGHEFGGHEWRDINGLPSSVPDPTEPLGSGMGVGICPACTRAGRGVEVVPRGCTPDDL